MRSAPKWWQDYVAGRLRSPRAIWQASRADIPAPQPNRQFPEEPATMPAPQRLIDRSVFNTDMHHRQWDRADWTGVDQRLVLFAARFQIRARSLGIPLYVHNAIRTEAEQDQLIERRVSRTPYPDSAHNRGAAVDIVHSSHHWQMDKAEWDYLGVIGQRCLDKLNAALPKANKLQLTWGGGWRNPWDPAHWEITNYRDTHPPVFIDPAGQARRFTPLGAFVGKVTLEPRPP